jgi:hypothetical protein
MVALTTPRSNKRRSEKRCVWGAFPICAIALLLAGAPQAQTTTAPGIDVEVYNPLNGTNRVCTAPGGAFWANVMVRPGSGAITCNPGCGIAAGGAANLATAVIDLAFDPGILALSQAENNPTTGHAAVDGLIQTQNAGEGRIGWALAGDWTPNADPNGSLANPCVMQKLATTDWVFRVQLAASTDERMTSVRLRREIDSQPFELSFADVCGSPAFKESTGVVNEVRGLAVMVTASCADVLFFDIFESADTSAWSQTAGLS